MRMSRPLNVRIAAETIAPELMLQEHYMVVARLILIGCEIASEQDVFAVQSMPVQATPVAHGRVPALPAWRD